MLCRYLFQLSCFYFLCDGCNCFPCCWFHYLFPCWCCFCLLFLLVHVVFVLHHLICVFVCFQVVLLGVLSVVTKMSSLLLAMLLTSQQPKHPRVAIATFTVKNPENCTIKGSPKHAFAHDLLTPHTFVVSSRSPNRVQIWPFKNYFHRHKLLSCPTFDDPKIWTPE